MRLLDTDNCAPVYEPNFDFENKLYQQTQCNNDVEIALRHAELRDILNQGLMTVPDIGAPRADDDTMCDAFVDRFLEPTEISLYMDKLYQHDLENNKDD